MIEKSLLIFLLAFFEVGLYDLRNILNRTFLPVIHFSPSGRLNRADPFGKLAAADYWISVL